MAIAVVGAGLAGLTAALGIAEAGCDVQLFERAEEPGGTSALSSGWIWRYRDLETFSWGAPHGDRGLQRVHWSELPDALVWLERSGVRRIATGTGNPRTEGIRIDGRQAADALARRLPRNSLRCSEHVVDAARSGDEIVLYTRHDGADAGDPPRSWTFDAVVFAGGGYGGNLDRLASEVGVRGPAPAAWAIRNAGGSDGSALDAALALGGSRVPVTGECYARAMPLGVELWPDDYVRFSQVYGAHAWAMDAAGVVVERLAHDWSDSGLVWEIGRRSGRGWYLLERDALLERTPYGTVARSVREAASAGAVVLESAEGGMGAQLAEHGTTPKGVAARRADKAVCAVGIRPGITHTMCGLRIDEQARVLGTGGGRRNHGPRPIRGVFAAGVEAGGIATGGYASGLAQALVLGRVAARTVSAPSREV